MLAKANEAYQLSSFHNYQNQQALADRAESEQVRLNATIYMQNRALGKPTTTVEIGPKQPDPVDDILDAATFDVAKLSKAQHDAIMGREPVVALPPAPAGFVDVEVVDEPHVPPPSATAGQSAAAAERVDGPPARPAWAEDPPEPPKRGLMTFEEANAALRESEQRVRAARATPTGADGPRPTRVSRGRRRRS